MGRVVLVTGVSRDLGGRFATLLTAEPDVDRVIGVDVVPPRQDLGRVRVVRADIRNPVIAKVITEEAVDTVVHMNVIASPHGAGGRIAMKEINVIGTMQLIAACQQSPTVESLVVKSSSAVYGASPRDPAMFSEDMEPRQLPRSGFGKDSVEVEGYVRGFARRRPDVRVVLLRCASVVGPLIDTPLTRYFSLPVVPTVLGFDPRLQFCHEDDALAALLQAALCDAEGTINVAGDGILMLSQALRRMGRPAIPVPAMAVGTVAATLRRSGALDFSAEQVSLLTYGRGIDTSRMRDTLKFTPDYTTAEAFGDFARSAAEGALRAERVVAAEQLIQSMLTSRR